MAAAIKATPTEVHNWLSADSASRLLRPSGLTAVRLRQLVWLSTVTCSVRDRFGSAFSRTSPLPASLPTSEWVKVRVTPQDGLLL